MKTAYEVLKETGVYPEDFISMASVGGVEKAMETYAKQQNFQLIEALKQAKEALDVDQIRTAMNLIERFIDSTRLHALKSVWNTLSDVVTKADEALKTINKLL